MASMMKSARADDAVASAGPTPDRPGADAPPAAGAIHYYMGSGALSVGRASAHQAHSSAGGEARQASEEVEDPDDLEWRCGVKGCNRPRAAWQESGIARHRKHNHGSDEIFLYYFNVYFVGA